MAQNIKKLLGLRIKELRLKQGLKQYQLANLINITAKNISVIEAGKSFVAAETITKLAKVLNVEPKDLFDFNHLQEEQDLKKSIIAMLNQLSTHDLGIIYKVVQIYLK